MPTRNTVLVIDEVSQIGPHPMQKLLEVQARTGMTIKALGDREQTQAIEAGDAVELLQRALPEEDLPYLNHTVRQKDKRGRHIAGLFRAGAAAEAIDELRRGGEAALIGGDHDQVVNRLAEFYLQRRDLHRSAGTGLTVTMTAPTNQDVADLSLSVRTKLKERGEIGALEEAIARNSEIYKDMRDTVVGYLEKLKGSAVLARRSMESAVAASRPAPGADL